MNKIKMICFDMDGVLVDLYQVPNWLQDIESQKTTPYEIAKPLIDMDKLRKILFQLKDNHYQIIIISWLGGGATKEYDIQVAKAKKDWLDKYQFPYDETFFLKYGTPKTNPIRFRQATTKVLIDDNYSIRQSWDIGIAVDGSKNFLNFLQNLVKED